MARRLARWTLRGIKGALAVVAGASLFLWPWSHAYPAELARARLTFRPLIGERVAYTAGWSRGRMGVGRSFVWVRGPSLEADRANWGAEGYDWKWETYGNGFAYDVANASGRWGFVSWTDGVGANLEWSSLHETLSFPCWLVACAAGAWPLASAVLFARRYRRTSLRLRLHLCCHCGYDLRATPSAGGATLATCPECGTPAAAA